MVSLLCSCTKARKDSDYDEDDGRDDDDDYSEIRSNPEASLLRNPLTRISTRLGPILSLKKVYCSGRVSNFVI